MITIEESFGIIQKLVVPARQVPARDTSSQYRFILDPGSAV
jgi:hypothetical protein